MEKRCEAPDVTRRQVATVAELSASIAHEINQPLASVVTNAHACQTWLLHDPPNLERARATLDRIIRDGHSAADVVRRIRALFKESAPIKAKLDVNQVVVEMLRLLSDELRDNDIAVETDLADDLPAIEADRVQLQQVVLNLIVNAVQAMGAGKWPEVARAQFAASGRADPDSGSRRGGIEDAALIFEPFFTTKWVWGWGFHLSLDRRSARQSDLGGRER